jgi:hypothetical protein
LIGQRVSLEDGFESCLGKDLVDCYERKFGVWKSQRKVEVR